MPPSKITRRNLLVGVSGAVAVTGTSGLWLAIDKYKTLLYRNAVERGLDFSPNAYLAVQPTGDIVIWVTRSEMGQGISTALPMLIADEMDADWSRVKIEQAIAGPEYDYGKQFTTASSSISGEWIMFRRAGATARAMLVNAAADLWKVSASQCTVDKSVVYHADSGSQASFAELATLAAQQWAPLRPTLKNISEFKLIGKSLQRLDFNDKVTGRAIYGLDIKLPNMHHAVIARPPSFNSTLNAVDDSATRQVPGIIDVVALKSGVAVLADSTFTAIKGRDALVCNWRAPRDPIVSDGDIKFMLVEALDGNALITDQERGFPLQDIEGDLLSAEYHLPYLAHVCMEPMNCTAHVRDGQCEVWAPTQAPQGARQVAAEISGLPLSNVRVHVTQLGGGFGRRASQDFVTEAVELASKSDGPVQVMWSREDDIRNSSYREASAHRLRATLDSITKLPNSWVHSIASAQSSPPEPGVVSSTATMGANNLPYELGAIKVEWCGVRLPIPTTIWRSVGYSSNTFVVESFISELASTAGRDPLDYRLEMLNADPRLKRCLERVGKLARWSNLNRHLGVATYNFGATRVAQIVEVKGSSIKDFSITNAWCVLDCGIAVHPDSVKAQIEGGMIDGLSAALYGGLNIEDNTVQQSNFHDYHLVRMNEVPRIEVEIISSNEPPSGVGEAGLPGAAPALATALFSLTGTRIRELPVKPVSKNQY